MPPRKIPEPPPSSRPKRTRRPSARAIEAAENQAAADRLAASRKKPRRGNVGATQAPQAPQAPQAMQPVQAQQSQARQAQMYPVNPSAPAPSERPYAPLPPLVSQVLPAPVPPYVPMPLPIPPPAPLQTVPQPSMPPAALAQAQAGPVHRTFQDAITYEPDSYHHLFYYFSLEEQLKARVGPLIRRDELKPPILGLIVPPCHDYDPPTPNNPDPDDIEPSRRRYYGSGGGGNGNYGGGHAGAGVAPGASHIAPQPPQQARSQQRPPPKKVSGKRSRDAMGPMPQLEQGQTTTGTPLTPQRQPLASTGESWWSHTLFVARHFRRFWKKEHAKRWYEYIWWRHEEQQHDQQHEGQHEQRQSASNKPLPPLSWFPSAASTLIGDGSRCQICTEIASLAALSDVPPSVVPSSWESTSMPPWESFNADMPDILPETPVDLSTLVDVSAHSPTIVLDSASGGSCPPTTFTSSSQVLATMLPPSAPLASPAPIPLILVNAASDDGGSTGEIENVPRWPATPLVIRLERANADKGAQTARAAYGRDLGWDVSCARVGCPRCCYAACPCACHKNAFSALMEIDRGRQLRRVNFGTAPTKGIAEATDLTMSDPRNRCVVAAATVVPSMPPMLAVQMVGGENDPADPGGADAEQKPDMPSRKRRRVSASRKR